MSRDYKALADFGPFTLDLTANVLLRGEERVHLPPLSLAILKYLIEHRERYVAKAELQQRFWEDANADTSECVNDSIYQQIRLIRDELGASKIAPYIETKYKGGYRFVASVNEKTESAASPFSAAASEAPAVSESDAQDATAELTIAVGAPAFGQNARSQHIILFAALFGIAGLALGLWASPRHEAKVKISRQLTNDGKLKIGPLLTDGQRIFFVEISDGSNHLVSIPITGGEPTQHNLPLSYLRLEDISHDGSMLLLQSEDRGKDGKLWTYGVSSHTLRPLGDGGVDAAWSPDGETLAATDAQGTSIRTVGGVQAIKAALPGRAFGLGWSPDGKRLRFSLSDFKYESSLLWEIEAETNRARRLAMLSEGQHYIGGGSWSQDGKYFFYDAGDGRHTDVWVKREDSGYFSFGATRPSRLTTGEPGSWSSPRASTDPSTLFVMNSQNRSELVRFEAGAGFWKPEWNGQPAFELDYSTDSQWVAYTSFPDHMIWKAKPAGSGRVKLTNTNTVLEAHQPHWSPDGSLIAFMGKNKHGQWRIFQVPANGGPAEELLSTGDTWGVPTWSPDGRLLMFSERPSAKPRAEMAIYLLDIAKRTLSEVPETKGLWGSRWSRDGRYVAAMTTDSKAIRIARWPAGQWKELIRMQYVDNLTWSFDSRYVHFDGKDNNDHWWLFRVSIPGGKVERIADLATFPFDENWWGVSPDGTPLALRASGTTEVYALTCVLP